MKKCFALLLVVLMCFNLAACNANSPATLQDSSVSSFQGNDSDSSSVLSSEKETVTSETKQQSNVTSKSNTKDNAKETVKNTSKKSGAASSSKNSQTVSTEVKKNSTYSPLLYKVTDSKGNIAWLFGSIHVGRDNYYPLPDYVTTAFNNSDKLAVEFDLIAFEKDITAQTRALSMLFSPYRSVKSHITANRYSDTYNKAYEILKENNMYNSNLEYYMPILWSNFIDNITYEKIGADSQKGIDRYLINQAYEKNIEVDSIESAELQYSMLAGFSDELQSKLLVESINSYYSETSKEELDLLMDTWAEGNPDKLKALLSEADTFEDSNEKQLYNEYNSAMRTSRDVFMTDYVINALSSGEEVFVCVGAAHVVGGNGIVDRLKKYGYTVEIIKK